MFGCQPNFFIISVLIAFHWTSQSRRSLLSPILAKIHVGHSRSKIDHSRSPCTIHILHNVCPVWLHRAEASVPKNKDKTINISVETHHQTKCTIYILHNHKVVCIQYKHVELIIYCTK